VSSAKPDSEFNRGLERDQTVSKNPTEFETAQADIAARPREQADSHNASTRTIVADKEFARGFEEVRKGLPFNPDNDSWEYERGRCFGFIAPLDMPLRIGRTLNPKALKLAEAAFDRKLLI
jgi:hypothetical protein